MTIAQPGCPGTRLQIALAQQERFRKTVESLV